MKVLVVGRVGYINSHMLGRLDELVSDPAECSRKNWRTP